MHSEINEQNLKKASREAMTSAIQNIAVGPDRGRDISRNIAELVMRGILRGDIDDVQIAIFFIALRMKRESMDEFLGVFDALSDSVTPAIANVDKVLVFADPFDGYVRHNTMTPFIPAVLSACGYHCVMHGVETIGPKHGVTAHKVFKLAGIDTTRSTDAVANDLRVTGWAYLDQSSYAPALFTLKDLRDSMVKRTALTTLERLLIPVRGKSSTHLVLGYVHNAYPEIYATVAKEAGYDTVLLLKGVEGGLAPALNKPIRRFFFNQGIPADINSKKQLIELNDLFDYSTAACGLDDSVDAVSQCLETGIDVLNGRHSIARDSLSLASAQILMAHQVGLSLSDAVEKVEMCLDNGSAKNCFDVSI
jgi:anthranilate phosphoribosyltransferase